MLTFLREQGYEPGRDNGDHQIWVKKGARSIPVPRHKRISLAVLRDSDVAAAS